MPLVTGTRPSSSPPTKARIMPHAPAIVRRKPAVSCRGVEKVFGSGDTAVAALRAVDLDIEPGAMTLLVGPSGCGKTTLISLIAGLLEPSAGEVHLLGNNLHALTGDALVQFRAKHIGFVFQQYNLLPSLTAVENACLPLLVNGVPRREAIARARALLDAVGLHQRADAFPSQLSGGQQQRVAIARALVHEPRLLVCDEPTAALDAESGRTVMELFRRVAVHADRAVVVVTHDNRVLSYGECIVTMSDGRITQVENNAQTSNS
jgi:putative ABC transport system ATP-binding protein